MTTTDLEGVDLPNLEAAVAFAVDCARDMIGHGAMAGSIDLHRVINITDQDGLRLATVSFTDVVKLVFSDSAADPS